MPQVSVVLPAILTSPEPAVTLACEATTVEEALRAVAAQAPRFAPRLFSNDRLLVGVVLGGVHLAPAQALTTRLSEGDRLELMPPVAGG